MWSYPDDQLIPNFRVYLLRGSRETGGRFVFRAGQDTRRVKKKMLNVAQSRTDKLGKACA